MNLRRTKKVVREGSRGRRFGRKKAICEEEGNLRGGGLFARKKAICEEEGNLFVKKVVHEDCLGGRRSFVKEEGDSQRRRLSVRKKMKKKAKKKVTKKVKNPLNPTESPESPESPESTESTESLGSSLADGVLTNITGE
jgi:hypothetical protein